MSETGARTPNANTPRRRSDLRVRVVAKGALDGPFAVLSEQESADETDDGFVVGEDAGDEFRYSHSIVPGGFEVTS
jgi:hypothetical protein